jgi:hypothetical protein
LPPPTSSDETDTEREERRLTPYMPLVIAVAITVFLALLWRYSNQVHDLRAPPRLSPEQHLAPRAAEVRTRDWFVADSAGVVQLATASAQLGEGERLAREWDAAHPMAPR